MSNWRQLLTNLYDHLEEHDRRLQLLRDIDRQILARSEEPHILVVNTIESLLGLIDARSGFLFHAYEGGSYRFFAACGKCNYRLPIPDISAKLLPVFGDLQRLGDSPFTGWLPQDSESLVVYEIKLEDRGWGILLLESPRPLQSDNDFVESVLGQVSIALRDLRVRARLQRYQEIHGLFFSKDLDQDECLKILREHVSQILVGHEQLLVQILFREDVYSSERKADGEDDLVIRIRWSTNENEIGTLVPFASFSGKALVSGEPFLMADPVSGQYASVYKDLSEFTTRTELAIPIQKDEDKPLGVLNIESPSEHAFSSVEIESLLDLVALVSPILAAVRRRNFMAHQDREAGQYAMNSYLQNLTDLYGHKFASRTDAIKFNIHAARSLIKNTDQPNLGEAIEHMQGDFEWLEESLKFLWKDFSSIADVVPVKIFTLFREISAEEKASATRYLRLDSERLEKLPPVRTSRLLKEHLRNLILNSVVSLDDKALGDRNFIGAIEITGEEFTTKQKQTRRGSEVDPVAELNRKVRISIRDNGVGVPREHREKIFLPGFSTRGTQGFGLPAALDFCRGFGGNLRLESEEGEYCQVWLEIPVYSSAT